MTLKAFKTAIPLIGTIFTVNGIILDCLGYSYCCSHNCPFNEEGECTIHNTDTLTPKQLTYLQTHHPELLL